jgi:UDP-N-acetylmuramoylalanine--D-glutamate ligase
LPRKREVTELKDKKVTVVGLGRSGVGAANLLTDLGALVIVTDVRGEDELKDFVRRLRPSVRRLLGSHPENIFTEADMIVISPGVPHALPQLVKADARGIPIIGELELAYRILSNTLSISGVGLRFLAVTGTNGKSTTTALLDFMMNKGGYRTMLGGNIGYALTEEIGKAVNSHQVSVVGKESCNSNLSTIDYIVAEISSFQLETIQKFRPQVAVVVNITPDHLDRYHSLQEYSDAKARIFENQGDGDFLVLNWDDPETIKVAKEKLDVKHEKPRIFYFSRQGEVDGVYSKDGVVYCTIPDLCTTSLIRADEIRIKGVHNLENAMAASAMALLAGCSINVVRESLKEFAGLEHRLEFVRELNGVRYFNDSKGTNVAAVMKSLESFSGPVLLIAGGRDKAGEFAQLKTLVKERVKALILIGEAAGKIHKALGDLTSTVMAEELKEAVQISRNMAEQGDVVLLSPACASFDMFENFEDRGRQFKKFVMELPQ